MSTRTHAQVEERLHALLRYIDEGRILEAMNEFYADDVAMQENTNPPTVGLAANIEREKQFLASVKEWKGSHFKTVAVGGEVSFYEAVFDWITTDGTLVHLEQVTVARWKEGRIVHERYYYDTVGMSKT